LRKHLNGIRITKFIILNNFKNLLMKYSYKLASLLGVEKQYVLDFISSVWFTGNTLFIKIYEKKFSKLVDRKYSLIVKTDTTILNLIAKVLDWYKKNKKEKL
jgi:dTDP-4-amino-4,6-dideoxygalactose transaminase